MMALLRSAVTRAGAARGFSSKAIQTGESFIEAHPYSTGFPGKDDVEYVVGPIFMWTLGVFTGGAIVYHSVRNVKIFGGTIPSTNNAKWERDTVQVLSRKPREGAPDSPVALNPFRHRLNPSQLALPEKD